MKLKNHKRGDSFFLTLTLLDFDGEPLALPVTNLTSQIRTKDDELIENIDIESTSIEGRYIFQVMDTTAWPVTEIYMDVKINRDGVITSTKTITIPVVRDISRLEV